jgi:PAS domain S-box-containing protein
MAAASRSTHPRADAAAFEPGSPAHFEALVESSEDAILSKDLDAVITSWNRSAERLYGYTPHEAVGRPISMIIPPERADEEKKILAKVLAGQRLEHYETQRVRKDGRRVFVSLTVSPIRSGDTIVGASVVARDISERVRARRRAEKLQEVTSALAREAEPDRAIEVLLEEATEALGADAVAVGLVTADGERIELAGSRGYSKDDFDAWRTFPLAADVPMSVAVRELSPVWSSSREDVMRRFPPLREADFRFEALAVLPLVIEGQALGSVSFSFAEARPFGLEERAFVASVMQQAAYSIDRVRIFDAERRTRQRLAFLARASEVLVESLNEDDILVGIAELSVRHLTDWCTIEVLDDEGGLTNAALAHVDRSKVKMLGEYRRQHPPDPDAQVGSGPVIRSGEPELIARVDDELLRAAATDEAHLATLRSLDLVSVMTVPLSARDRTLGAMTFASSDPQRAYDTDDLELAADLGRRTGQALDTARLYQREHETALTLQRALLPQSLPEIPGVELAVRYLPAEAGLEVGGDWYDVLQPSPDRVDLVIGDVAGRGVRAAAVMGRLAIALRAYALQGQPVEEVVEGVNRLMGQFESREIATLCQVSIDPGSGAGTYVRAGHPPALLRAPGGEISELTGRGCPPLGWLDELEPRASPIRMEPGSVLLLYTDGLIERREFGLDVGIDRLKSAFAASSADPRVIVREIPTALGAERVPDDIAVLAARVG